MDDTARPVAPSRAYANYVLAVLVLVYVINYVDRLALNVVGGLCYWQASKSYAAELAAGK